MPDFLIVDFFIFRAVPHTVDPGSHMHESFLFFYYSAKTPLGNMTKRLGIIERNYTINYIALSMGILYTSTVRTPLV